MLTPVVTRLIGVGGKKQEEEARREKETPVVTGLIGVGGKIQEEQHFWKDRDNWRGAWNSDDNWRGAWNSDDNWRGAPPAVPAVLEPVPE